MLFGSVNEPTATLMAAALLSARGSEISKTFMLFEREKLAYSRYPVDRRIKSPVVNMKLVENTTPRTKNTEIIITESIVAMMLRVLVCSLVGFPPFLSPVSWTKEIFSS